MKTTEKNKFKTSERKLTVCNKIGFDDLFLKQDLLLVKLSLLKIRLLDTDYTLTQHQYYHFLQQEILHRLHSLLTDDSSSTTSPVLRY